MGQIVPDRLLDSRAVIDGSATITPLPSGSWTLEVTTTDGQRRWSGSAIVEPGRLTDLTLR
jgi:hypothetical protein